MSEELSHGKQMASLIGPDLRRLLTELKNPDEARELLEDLHPEDLADVLSELEDEDMAEILRMLPDDLAASIFERLRETQQEVLVELLGSEDAADIAAEMSADDRADLIENLPEDVGKQLLESIERVDPEAAAEARTLGRYEEGTAGALMTLDYLSVAPNTKVTEVIDVIRKSGAEAETAYYVFVVRESNRLSGVASLRQVLLADQDAPIGNVMTERVITVGPDTDQEEVARQMSKYDLLAIPVIDQRGILLGVITADDIMDVLTQEGTEDVQKLGGMETLEHPYFASSFLTLIKKRGTWLIILFVGEFFTGTALRAFDEVIGAVSTLAFYIPLLISTGGNSGSQSATLIIRGMAVGEIKLKDWHRIMWRELGQGLVLGLGLAAIGVTRVMMWGDGKAFAAVIAITILGIVTMGCVVGSMLPLLLKRLGLDPATSSTPFISSLVDVLGILIYFNIAKFILSEVIEHAVKAKAMVGH
ncbi:MAG: magnesium transporter [Polyangiales bacterium]